MPTKLKIICVSGVLCGAALSAAATPTPIGDYMPTNVIEILDLQSYTIWGTYTDRTIAGHTVDDIAVSDYLITEDAVGNVDHWIITNILSAASSVIGIQCEHADGGASNPPMAGVMAIICGVSSNIPLPPDSLNAAISEYLALGARNYSLAQLARRESGSGAAGVSSVNNLTGAVTIAPGTGTSVRVEGTNIFIDATGSGTGDATAWSGYPATQLVTRVVAVYGDTIAHTMRFDFAQESGSGISWSGGEGVSALLLTNFLDYPGCTYPPVGAAETSKWAEVFSASTNVPADAVIRGIQIGLNFADGMDETATGEFAIRLGTNFYGDAEYSLPGDNVGIRYFGDSTSLWETTATAGDINSTNFGFRARIKNYTGEGAAYAMYLVDAHVVVHYAPFVSLTTNQFGINAAGNFEVITNNASRYPLDELDALNIRTNLSAYNDDVGYLTDVPYGTTDSTAYRGDHGVASSNLAYAASTNAEAARVIATNAQAVADAALPKAGGTLSGNLNAGAQSITDITNVSAHSITMTGGNLNAGGGSVTGVADVIGSGIVAGTTPGWSLYVGADRVITNAASTVLGYNTIVSSNRVRFSASEFWAAPTEPGWYFINVNPLVEGPSSATGNGVNFFIRQGASGALVQDSEYTTTTSSRFYRRSLSRLAYADGTTNTRWSVWCENTAGNALTNLANTGYLFQGRFLGK